MKNEKGNEGREWQSGKQEGANQGQCIQKEVNERKNHKR